MNIYYRFDTCRECDEHGQIKLTPQILAYGDNPQIVFSALRPGVDGVIQRVDLSAAASWQFAIDADRNSATVPVCRTLSGDVVYNAEEKTLTFPADAGTAEFLAAVDGKDRVHLIAELYGFDADGKRIYRFPWMMTGVMPVDTGLDGDPESVPDVYVKKDYFDGVVGSVNDLLDAINREEI